MPLSSILTPELTAALMRYTTKEVTLITLIRLALVDYVDLRQALGTRYEAVVAHLCTGGPNGGTQDPGTDGHSQGVFGQGGRTDDWSLAKEG